MCPGAFCIQKTGFYSYEYIPQRYIFAFLAFFGMVSAFAMRSYFNIAITQMVLPVSQNSTKNETLHGIVCPRTHHPIDLTTVLSQKIDYFDWDEKTQGLILSSFYYGYILTHIPGAFLTQRFGGKRTLGFCLLATSIFTLLTPLAAHIGSTFLMALRFCEGVGEGVKFPAMSHLLAQWAPPLERSKLTSFVFSGALVGLMVGISLGGFLIELMGNWKNVFYVFGTAGVIWFILWLGLAYDDPSSHPFVSEEERQHLLVTIGQIERKKTLGTPWSHMMKSLPLWSLIIAEFGHSWGTYLMFTDLPKYMSDVMHVSVAQNGILSSLPILLSWIVSLISSYLADLILEREYFSVTSQRKIFATVGAVGPAIGVFIVSFSGCNQILVVSAITSGIGLMGFCFPSLKVNTIDLSPNHSATIMALANGVGCLAGIVAPYLAGVLTPNRTLEEWRINFWIMAGIEIVSNCAFLLFGSAEVQYWNDMENFSP